MRTASPSHSQATYALLGSVTCLFVAYLHPSMLWTAELPSGNNVLAVPISVVMAGVWLAYGYGIYRFSPIAHMVALTSYALGRGGHLVYSVYGSRGTESPLIVVVTILLTGTLCVSAAGTWRSRHRCVEASQDASSRITTAAALSLGILVGVLGALLWLEELSLNVGASAAVIEPLPAAPAAPRRGEIRIDPAIVQNLGVTSVLAEPRAIARPIRTAGYVDYDRERVVSVNARISGWVQRLYVNYVGQQVHKGERLLDVYSPELVLTEEDFLRSRELANRTGGDRESQDDGRELMTAAQLRIGLMGIAFTEVERLQRSGRASEMVPLDSTADGVVTQIKTADGAHVSAGDELYAIADLSRVWVYADVYERDLHMVKLGQKGEVTSAVLNGQVLRGVVSYVYPQVDEQTRTVRVRLEFANRGGLLKPGMYVETTLLDESGDKNLAVPTEAVLNSGIRSVVIVDRGGGRFEPRPIEIGGESSGFYPVLSGLQRGERVVTSGQFLIDSESNLNETFETMTLRPDADRRAAGE